LCVGLPSRTVNRHSSPFTPTAFHSSQRRTAFREGAPHAEDNPVFRVACLPILNQTSGPLRTGEGWGGAPSCAIRRARRTKAVSSLVWSTPTCSLSFKRPGTPPLRPLRVLQSLSLREGGRLNNSHVRDKASPRLRPHNSRNEPSLPIKRLWHFFAPQKFVPPNSE